MSDLRALAPHSLVPASSRSSGLSLMFPCNKKNEGGVCALRIVDVGYTRRLQSRLFGSKAIAKQKRPVKATKSIDPSDTRNRHEHRTAPRRRRRDIPGKGVEEVQATATGTSRSVKLHPRRAHLTGFCNRCPCHDVYAVDGFEQTEETPIQGHELLVTRPRDRAGPYYCRSCGWCLDDGRDAIPDQQVRTRTG